MVNGKEIYVVTESSVEIVSNCGWLTVETKDWWMLTRLLSALHGNTLLGKGDGILQQLRWFHLVELNREQNPRLPRQLASGKG